MGYLNAGKTPMVEIEYRHKGRTLFLYSKIEYYNPSGSIKDRPAGYIYKKARERGELKEGMPIIEATSGNMGVAFCAIGRAYGHEVHIFIPDWMSVERIKLIESLGGIVHLVSKEQGGFVGSIKLADELAEKIDGYRPQQFSNEDNTMSHFHGTGVEIVEDLALIGKTADIFVAGVGTGGTVMGVGGYLKKIASQTKIHPLEPLSSPTLSTGHKVGNHRIQGISDEFIPQICRLDELDEVVTVDDGDSIIMAQRLSKEFGLGVGISSGANFIGCAQMQIAAGGDKTAVTVFSDDSKKYLSTDLTKEEPLKEGFLNGEIELVNMKQIN